MGFHRFYKVFCNTISVFPKHTVCQRFSCCPGCAFPPPQNVVLLMVFQWFCAPFPRFPSKYHWIPQVLQGILQHIFRVPKTYCLPTFFMVSRMCVSPSAERCFTNGFPLILRTVPAFPLKISLNYSGFIRYFATRFPCSQNILFANVFHGFPDVRFPLRKTLFY